MPVGLHGRKPLASKDAMYYHRKCLIQSAPENSLCSEIRISEGANRLLDNFSESLLKKFIHKIVRQNEFEL